MKILICLIFILVGAMCVSLYYALLSTRNIKTKSKVLSMSIPIKHKTNLSFSGNYIAFHDNVVKNCNLNGYIDFLEREHELYLKTNVHESFQQFLDRRYPPKKN